MGAQKVKLRRRPVDYSAFAQSVASAEDVYVWTQFPHDVFAVVPQ